MARKDEVDKLSKAELIDLVNQLERELDACRSEIAKREVYTEGSYIEGEASVKDGDWVGRDQYVGLDGEEINQLMETLLKHFPRGSLHPEQLDAILSQFQSYHEELHEWKELHNGLDDILNAFGQYNALIERVDLTRKIPKLRELRNQWSPVSAKITTLLDWAEKIKHIGKPYKVVEKGLEGERWAVFLSQQCQDIEELLTDDPPILKRVSFRYLHSDPVWWKELYESTRQFDHVVTEQMHQADKRLRSVAGDLYELSSRLGGTKDAKL